MSFQDLIGRLGTMSKAQSIDDTNKDAKVAAAAADGAAAGAAADGDKGGDDGAGTGGEGTQAAAGSANAAAGEGSGEGAGTAAQGAQGDGTDQEALGKSLTLTDGEGNPIDVLDAAPLLKALGDRLDATEGDIKQALGAAIVVMTQQSASIATMLKSFADQGVVVTEQAELIKSLRTDLDAIRAQPAGRRSVSNPAQISASDPLIKSLNTDAANDGMAPTEFLAKCLSLQKTGGMSLQEVAIAEASIGSNVAVPSHIVSKVFSSK